MSEIVPIEMARAERIEGTGYQYPCLVEANGTFGIKLGPGKFMDVFEPWRSWGADEQAFWECCWSENQEFVERLFAKLQVTLD